MTKMRLLSHGTNKTVRMTAAPNGEGEENNAEVEAGSEDEEEMDGDDGDAAAAKQRSRKNEEQEYDNDEGNVNFDEEETNQEGYSSVKNEPHHEQICLQGLRPGSTQTRLYNHRRWLEA